MDIDGIKEIVGVASGAASATGEAVRVLDAVKSLFSGQKDNPDTIQQNALLNELATKLTVANYMNVQISEKLRELALAVDQQNNFEERIKQYRLIETDRGAVLYILRDNYSLDKPIHYICPRCLEKERQFHYVTGSSAKSYKVCQNCNHVFSFREEPKLEPNARRSYGKF